MFTIRLKVKKLGHLFVILSICISCSKEDNFDNYKKVKVTLEKPSNFPDLKYDLSTNPLTNKGIELGRQLFYEGKLSSDGATSCGFCHEQNTAFTHHGHQFSHGVGEKEGTRNAPAVQNMAFQSQFSWDGSTAHLDRFPIIPITNPVEMNETIENVLLKLKKDSNYKNLFAQAFDDAKINRVNMMKALSQFMITMISSNSKYDKYVRKERGGTMSKEELKGLELFKTKCATCHKTDLFTDDSFRNNGLPQHIVLKDKGRFLVTDKPSDKYKFKVPSLRNVSITNPYMHDGRFYSLEQVLDFYDSGVKNTENLDPILKQGNNRFGIPLTKDEKKSIIQFLKTLTDEEFINDQRFSE